MVKKKNSDDKGDKKPRRPIILGAGDPFGASDILSSMLGGQQEQSIFGTSGPSIFGSQKKAPIIDSREGEKYNGIRSIFIASKLLVMDADFDTLIAPGADLMAVVCEKYGFKIGDRSVFIKNPPSGPEFMNPKEAEAVIMASYDRKAMMRTYIGMDLNEFHLKYDLPKAGVGEQFTRLFQETLIERDDIIMKRMPRESGLDMLTVLWLSNGGVGDFQEAGKAAAVGGAGQFVTKQDFVDLLRKTLLGGAYHYAMFAHSRDKGSPNYSEREKSIKFFKEVRGGWKRVSDILIEEQRKGATPGEEIAPQFRTSKETASRLAQLTEQICDLADKADSPPTPTGRGGGEKKGRKK